MSKVYADKIEPRDSSMDVTIGTSTNTVTLAGNDLRANTVKDSGGNTLWTSDGSGNLSSVNSALAGNLKLLSTQTASGASSVSFTSDIDDTYDVYIFKFINIHPSTDNQRLEFQVNASGQTGYNEVITSTIFYARHSEADTNAQLTYYTAGDQAQGTAYQKLGWISDHADHSLVGDLHLFSPSNTTYVKHFYSRTTWNNDTDGLMDGFTAGYINTTTAIDDIQFKANTGNFDGTIKMYGLG
jgi:hypothetical protein